MSHKKATQSGRYNNLKSLQTINLDELQYLQHTGLKPLVKQKGFFEKCVDSFKGHFPQVTAIVEEFFYEPIPTNAAEYYGHAE
jgi:hypothetical protein